MKSRNKGYVSLYLCLVLAIIIPLLATMIESARYSVIRQTLQCAVNLSLDSLLAEYNKELFDEYDLFFIDSSYGLDKGDVNNVLEHLEDYLSYNLEPDKDLIFPGYSNITGLGTDSVEIVSVARATDNGGEVFKFAVLQYMLEYYGLAYVQEAIDMFDNAEITEILESDVDIENNLGQNEDVLMNFEFPEDTETDYTDVDITDPAEGLTEYRNKGILEIVLKDEEISSTGITSSIYASERDLVNGDGLFFDNTSYNTLALNVLMNEYVLLKCGNYLNQKESSVLDYQVEYVIAGNSNDTDNLKSIVWRLLIIRGAANTIYFMTDDELKEESKAMAEVLATLCLCPSLSDLFEAVIDAAWIYGESVYDVRHILSGGKEPLITTKDSFDLSFENAVNFLGESLYTADYSDDNESGLDYEGYLRLLLYLTNQEDVSMRTMDIIEMDVRKNSGNDNFRMDDCIYGFKVEMIIVSSYGYEFLVKKENRYC